MAGKGAITVRTYLGNEALPVADAGVHIIERSGDVETLLAYRTTDRNGKTAPLEVDTPDASNSQSPEGGTAFTTVDVRVRHPKHHTVYVRGVQVFSDILTDLPVQLIPNSERLPDKMTTQQVYITPQQL